MDKQRLIDKDALLKKLKDSGEVIETIDRNINKNEEDKLGNRYCDWICRIIGSLRNKGKRQPGKCSADANL